MRVRKLTEAELQVAKLVVAAQYYSDFAKKDFFSKKEYYNKKSLYISAAIHILNNIHTNVIRYKTVVGVPDQHGNESNIFYFEFNLPQGRKQISFHGFEKNTRKGGHSEIEWTGVTTDSAENAKLLNEVYNFGFDMEL